VPLFFGFVSSRGGAPFALGWDARSSHEPGHLPNPRLLSLVLARGGPGGLPEIFCRWSCRRGQFLESPSSDAPPFIFRGRKLDVGLTGPRSFAPPGTLTRSLPPAHRSFASTSRGPPPSLCSSSGCFSCRIFAILRFAVRMGIDLGSRVSGNSRPSPGTTKRRSSIAFGCQFSTGR